MRIVIDLQGAQTESRFRGIGRYSLAIAQAIVRNRGEHEIIIALNGLFPETIEPIRAAFEGILPQENIRVWYAPGPVRELELSNESRRTVAELIREVFLASLNPDVIFITSLFEGYVDDAVTSIGILASKIPTVVMLYDLIPLLHHEKFLDHNPSYKQHYSRKIEYLKKADRFLVISESSAQEAINALGVSENLITNISSACEHAPAQAAKFFWNESAHKAITACELIYSNFKLSGLPLVKPVCRPKLAYVSPLPPERTGIANYSAELLPELAKYYDITVVVEQENIADVWIQDNCLIHDSQWLMENAQKFDRVLYHIGNSPFHQHMLALIKKIPGTIVLHDFFLGHMLAFLEQQNIIQYAFTQALYYSHGYIAVREHYHITNAVEAKIKYPANLNILLQGNGVIVHSEYSRQLARNWYGENLAIDWKMIPLLRTSGSSLDRNQCRAKLNISKDDFVICSFGFLGLTKLNHRLLKTWLSSKLASDARCLLIFVGENCNNEYGMQLIEDIKNSGINNTGDRVRITGWVDDSDFLNYLVVADTAVQLRTLSRGETSAAVLDCMNHSLPVVVNSNGSMSDLPPNCVWMLPDEFEDCQLIEALEILWQNEKKRAQLGRNAKAHISTYHLPPICAKKYFEAIESFYSHSQSNVYSLINAIGSIENFHPSDEEFKNIAKAIAQSLPEKQATKQLLLDISATCRNDLKTGIERVARALLMALLDSPPAGYRIEPVYLSNEGGVWHYRYARHYTLELLKCPVDGFIDDIVEPHNGDVLLGLDISGHVLIEADASGLFTDCRNLGVAIHFIIYDLLPIQFPQFFPPGANINHTDWLKTVVKFDGAFCISQNVANELKTWLEVNKNYNNRRAFQNNWFHLGADVEKSAPTLGLPEDAEKVLKQLNNCISFVMVGTIEPRKGYLQTLAAFTQLWRDGMDVNLVIIGKEGWKGLLEDIRRTIPEIVNTLCAHSELNKHLFWLEGISDEYLEKIYAASACLIAASEGEGFGLPLIEAARHKLPIIARDIPVFREVAGKYAFYFKSKEPADLAEAIKEWLVLYSKKQYPRSDSMPWLTWKESVKSLVDKICIEEK